MALNTEIEIITQEKCADKVVNALKALVKTALVTDHIKYIKKIQSSDNPEVYYVYQVHR